MTYNYICITSVVTGSLPYICIHAVFSAFMSSVNLLIQICASGSGLEKH